MRVKTILPLLILALFIIGCRSYPMPTQEQLITDLKTVHKLLSNGDNLAAAKHFKGPDDASQEKLVTELNKVLRNQELSMAGIEILDKEGRFGKLNEVFPERGARWMERNGITTPEDCYGLGYGNAEVAAYWDGKKFLIIRLDDVGKL